MTFRERLLSVQVSQVVLESRTPRARYDTELVAHQFGGKSRKERIAEYADDTQGFGAGETDSKGNVWANDPKTKEKRILTPKEVATVYLGEKP